MIISWLLKKKCTNPSECVEETFFRTMLIVGMVGCSIGLFVDLLIISSFDYNIWLRLLLIQVLLTALYALKTFLFKYVSMIVISSMVVLITFRGLLFGNYQAVTCTLLITIGLVSSLTTKGAARFFFNLLILVSLFLILIRTNEAFDLLPVLQNAVPYLISYFIVTISSGALKDRYERNQVKLTELVELLNKKNAKIYEQHRRLLNSHDVLSRANENLGELVAEKTTTIEQKNHHLQRLPLQMHIRCVVRWQEYWACFILSMLMKAEKISTSLKSMPRLYKWMKS